MSWIIPLFWAASSLCHGAVLDLGGPTDLVGRPQVDLYDASGLQRGTTANPLQTGLPPGAATAAAQATQLQVLQQILAIQPPRSFSSRVLTGNATTTIKSGSGILHTVIIGNAASSGTISIYDGSVATANLLFVASAGTPSGGLLSGSGNPQSTSAFVDIGYSTSLIAVTAGANANNFTVVFQ